VAFPLCTKDEVKRAHKLDNPKFDDVIDAYILGVSEHIESLTNINFEPADADPRRFLYRGGGIVSIKPYVLRSVQEISIDTDGDTPQVIAAGGYSLRPLPPLGGLVYMWVQLAGERVWQDAYGRPAEREITITGDWGFEEDALPEGIKAAAVFGVRDWLESTQWVTASTPERDEVPGFDVPRDLPLRSRMLVGPWMRTGA
jgi:hypothetical protein